MIQGSQNPKSEFSDQVSQLLAFAVDCRFKQRNRYKGTDQMIWWFDTFSKN